MANILGIITALVLTLAAFVAIKNKERLQTEISSRDSEEASLVVSQDRLKAAQEELRRLPLETEGINTQIAAKTEEETGLNEENDALKAAIETKTSQIASNRTRLDEIRSKTDRLGGIQDLAPKMKAMRIELEELDLVIDQKEASLANLTSESTNTVAEADRRKKEFEDFANGKSLATLKTRIRSIYPTWGFVTLADGNNSGVIANSTLDVVRDGGTIAKLLVTAVESRTSSATIIPDSIVENAVLMVGDRVVPSVDEPSAEDGVTAVSN